MGYKQGDPSTWDSGNNRNGSSAKTVPTDAGSIPVMVPRDRNGTFEPKLIPKHQRRLNGFNDLIISLIARGMTTRDVQAHIADVYQVEISPELVSTITDSILRELRAWQSRTFEGTYPIIYWDAIVVKVLTGAHVINGRYMSP